jgi:ubiquinone biosynthesis protein
MSKQHLKFKGQGRRLLLIIGVALKYFVFHRLTFRRRKSLGERLRLAFQELGIIFIKVGQLLSGRYDLLKEADLEELKKLLDQANPLPDEVVHRVIGEELGTKAQQLSPLTLLSSASVAQVYATTVHGNPVVIKVLRPGVREQAETDLAIVLKLLLLAKKFSSQLRQVKVIETMNEIRSWIREETNFATELDNMERYRSHLTNSFPTGQVRPDLGRIIVPKTYPEFSTTRVLVMERLAGVTISDWLRGKRPIDITERRYDPQTSIMTFFSGTMRPVFEGNSRPFHGDPHPANIVILPDGNVGLIDFGLLGEYGAEYTQAANRMFFAIYLKNAEMAAKAVLQFNRVSSDYYEQILPDMKVYVQQVEREGFGEMMKGTARIMQKHQLYAPAMSEAEQAKHELGTLMIKFVLLVDSLAHDFFPGKTTTDLLGPELEAGIKAQIVRNLKHSRMRDSFLGLAYAVSEIAAEGPEAVGKAFANFL